MEYFVEKDQKVKKLSKTESGEIALMIYDNFRTYDRGRKSQLEKAKLLKDEIYFKNVIRKEKDKTKQWKSTVSACKLFMYSQILKAFIWKNTYANPNSMFDVSGESQEADNDSNKEKTMLVDCLYKMEFPKTLDTILDSALIYGELISFVTWRKETEEYRRPIEFFSLNNPKNIAKMLAAKAKGENFYIDERTSYDNPYAYSVDPENFVFDTTQSSEWDTCPKINRTWKTPDYIINNKYFKVTKEVAEELKALVKGGADENDIANQLPEDLKDKVNNGSTVEVLEHWGDLTLKDGTVLKNWYAVVVAGKYLVAFEKNPIVINPFSIGYFFLDPETGRGISPLFGIYELAAMQDNMLRRTVDLQSLNENKPVYAPKRFFGDDPSDIEVYPGKIIEYDPQMYATLPIVPMQFDTSTFKDTLGYLDDLMSEISGIFPNMAGASESERTTATEISTKVEGQLTRLKMLLDIICQNLILPTIKKVAELKANFTFGEETIFVNNENKPENVIINDAVRQAKYRFTYADRSATSERFNFADLVAQAVQMFVKGGLAVNLEEFFKWYLEQKGVENPERFLANINLLAPEVQQALMQNPTIAPVIQEMQKRVEMAKQGQKLPENEVQDVSMEQNQPQEEDFMSRLGSLKGRHLLNE